MKFEGGKGRDTADRTSLVRRSLLPLGMRTENKLSGSITAPMDVSGTPDTTRQHRAACVVGQRRTACGTSTRTRKEFTTRAVPTLGPGIEVMIPLKIGNENSKHRVAEPDC